MCRNVGREGTASLAVIPASVQKISQENERGGLEIAPPPVGRGLKCRLKSRFLQIRLQHESRDKYVIHISKTPYKKCYFETPHYYVSIMGQQNKSRG